MHSGDLDFAFICPFVFLCSMERGQKVTILKKGILDGRKSWKYLECLLLERVQAGKSNFGKGQLPGTWIYKI